MSEPLIQQQLHRLAALLSEERAGPGLEACEPEWSAAELGAGHAVGYRTRQPDVQVSVYVFTDRSRLRDARETLKGRFAGDKGIYARTATNGPMLFVAHTRIDGRKGRDAEHRLDRLLTAFSGDE